MKLFSHAFLAILISTSAHAEGFNFCWIGSNGYTMSGNFEVPDQLITNEIITESKLAEFKIVGYHEGNFVGSWSMADLQEGTTWHFRFDPVSMTLPTGGEFAATESQGWNANGDVSDCGNPGFGFNSGSFAQDICINGQFILASSVDPTTPIHVTTAPLPRTCESRGVMSKQ